MLSVIRPSSPLVDITLVSMREQQPMGLGGRMRKTGVSSWFSKTRNRIEDWNHFLSCASCTIAMISGRFSMSSYVGFHRSGDRFVAATMMPLGSGLMTYTFSTITKGAKLFLCGSNLMDHYTARILKRGWTQRFIIIHHWRGFWLYSSTFGRECDRVMLSEGRDGRSQPTEKDPNEPGKYLSRNRHTVTLYCSTYMTDGWYVPYVLMHVDISQSDASRDVNGEANQPLSLEPCITQNPRRMLSERSGRWKAKLEWGQDVSIKICDGTWLAFQCQSLRTLIDIDGIGHFR